MTKTRGVPRRLATTTQAVVVLTLTASTILGAVVSPASASAPPARAAVTAGQSAWVSVSVARLWQSPRAPRRVDRPALAAPVRFRAWLRAMTLSQRRDLSSHSDTEALMGERVVVRRVSGTWAKVVVPDQPSQKAAGGYPGWIPVRQLTERPAHEDRTGRDRAAAHRLAPPGRAGGARITEISSGTTLPVLGRVGDVVRVRAPRGAVRRVLAKAVVVHRRGTVSPHPAPQGAGDGAALPRAALPLGRALRFRSRLLGPDLAEQPAARHPHPEGRPAAVTARDADPPVAPGAG